MSGELEAGRVIGSYRVVRMIGKGGMGTVYEVEHVELGVRYALKTFTFDPNDAHADTLKTKFLEEGKVLARLKHPNIAHVFDLAFDEQSQLPYFVMDLVTYEDGESYTAEDVEPADIDEELVLQWFTEVAAALDYIHGEGIVHRDVKPGNLLLGKDNHVVLTDFGISRVFGKKMQEGVHAEKTIMTTTGRGKVVLGTEKYMAPEVAKGEEATPAADAYALGVMLLRWLTGFYYSDNPGCIALLSHKQYKWLPVIAQLVAPASRRPEDLSALVKKIKVGGAPEGTEKKKGTKKRKKRNWLHIVFTALFFLSAVAGASWFAWKGFQYYEQQQQEKFDRLKKQQDDFQRQLREREEAEKKERERLAEEERKRKDEERRKEEERRRKEEEERVKIVAPTQNVDATSSSRQGGKERGGDAASTTNKPMIIIKDKDDEEEKDYGPIPNKDYKWIVGGVPKPVEFQMWKGAKIEMLPMKKGVFYMSNNWDDKKARHKVTITRPFWISKFCVTAEQWREFDAGYVADCLPIEKALQGKYPVSKTVTRPQFDSFCKFMTQKYKSQLPDGYVFRLPSEAEWEYALDYEGTWRKYAQQGKTWQEATMFNSQLSRESMMNLVSKYNLMRNREWETKYDWGWSHPWSIFIGGRLQPYANGVFDAQQHVCFLLDKVSWRGGFRLNYSDEEVDPLRWNGSDGSDRSVGRAWQFNRDFNMLTDRHIQHLVLGPDLIKEKAWENPRKNVECVKPVPNQRYAWERPDKVLKIIKKPKELTFKMAEGGDMIFCTIPSVKEFNMSNPDGQDKLYHKMTLTKPFWITKYCVTTKQWREYAKYDCEGIVREVEKYFPKNPIYMPFTRPQWDGFCEYLNKRYGHQLPKGYVFRLPTEAEWEWAFVGDKNSDIRKVSGGRFNNCDGRIKDEFVKLLKKNRVPKSLQINMEGYLALPNRVYVGGRVDCTETFGVCDMYMSFSDGGSQAFVFDTFDSDGIEEADKTISWFVGWKIGQRDCQYEEHEIDPCRFAGRLANRSLKRKSGTARLLDPIQYSAYAHIVVGPDIETALKKKELEPYPTEDFGGMLLSDVITHGGLSSKHPHVNRFNTPDKFRRMISSENKLLDLDAHKDVDGCVTDKEDSPWVQLNLDARRTIMGLHIEMLDRFAYAWARHLRVWTSEDGKTWREVAAENQRKHRYRFDLQRKNVKAKYIRIGREPGFVKDFFSLDKILIYGK